MKRLYVTKANGKRKPFNSKKIEDTCIKAGADNVLAKKISHYVFNRSYNGISTKKIFRLVSQYLSSKKNFTIKQRYGLKDSLLNMGPEGFFFEKFMGRVLEKFGYEIRSTGSFIFGRCARHEIDIIAIDTNKQEKYLIECKHHTIPDVFTGLKESLYTHARFLDLMDQSFDREMLVSNTKLSDDAIKYARCIGQKVLCWNYPPDNDLAKMITQKKIYPITLLDINKNELTTFLKIEFVLLEDLVNKTTPLLIKNGISKERLQSLQIQAEKILSS